uniref:Heat shock-like protein n=1 Tax=Picea glauca TaxID=3330 RepID=Q40868_PICGL|nr:heat shock-like protein [Picea glauca]
METTFYSILGVNKDSSSAEIRSAYRKLAMKWHPDKWSTDPSSSETAKLRFQQIQEAYSVLSDDTKRALYDAGMYEPSEDMDAFCDFLDELSSLIATVKVQSNKDDELLQLQEMFTKMLEEDWFSTDNFEAFKEISSQHSDDKPENGQDHEPYGSVDDL